MTEFGELAAVNAVDALSDDKCPFCYKKRHAFASAVGDETTKVVSKPGQLGCVPLPVTGPWNHTTAKHHLISAKQCFEKVRRLVRMATAVGYDINAPPNGIGLPTVANNITYTIEGRGPQKFGRFDDPDRRTIAFAVMEQAKAQWHVGHHAFVVEIPPGWAEEKDDDDIAHLVSYDVGVIAQLLKIMDAWARDPPCKKPEDRSSELKAAMDDLSKDIKGHLGAFGKGDPRKSAPFFVSRLAFDYAESKGGAARRAPAAKTKRRIRR